MALTLNTRRQKILNLLVTRSEYVSPGEIARDLNVSRRTIYYDIDKINEWLRGEKLPELEMVREKGIYASPDVRRQLQSRLEDAQDKTTYIFSPQERAKCIVCCIIYASEPVYIEQLTDYFAVSRNTIFADLKLVEQQLDNYDLSLAYHPKSGYYVEGDIIRIRALFLMLFEELQLLFLSNMLPFLKKEDISSYYDTLCDIARELHVEYVKDAFYSVAALLPMAERNRDRIHFANIRMDKLCASREYELICAHFSDLPLDEQIYFTLHLLGSRVNMAPEQYFSAREDKQLSALTQKLIAEFERLACIHFEDKEALSRALFMHLSISMYRYRFGIQIGNVLAGDIRQQYPDLFSITKRVVPILEDYVGAPVPDSETAYLTLHFGSALKITEANGHQLRILIVCVNGISTGNMLRHEIERILPFAEISGVRAAGDLMQAQKDCSLIISTVKLTAVVPVITVHPILTEFDKKSILNHPLVASRTTAVQSDRLFKIVRKYVAPEHYDALRQEIDAYLQSGMNEVYASSGVENGLLSLLDLSRIQICRSELTWEDSLRLSGVPLLESESIEERYIDTIIDQLHTYGFYMFLNDDVILAHARPEDGVSHLDLSMLLLPGGVAFSENLRARLVILLAAEDQEKHLTILQDIISLAANDEVMEQLLAAHSSAEVLQLITNYIKNVIQE